ncbi:gonadal protein gdl isoform X1 [Bacillus rossius redtenbacheri]|uniref:gonadal protein gdl isoform X1 n=1 Tax=Bacillus rossius redtenbacheri TaxID=93214 RepID=UPI002FDD7FDF
MAHEYGSPTPEDLQNKVYFLLEKLQQMSLELPTKYQQRIPCELLSGLANCLLNETVFEIVKGLMEIQHVTEKHLFQQRLQLINKHSLELQELLQRCPDEEARAHRRALLLQRHRTELKSTDMKLVMQLDQKSKTFIRRCMDWTDTEKKPIRERPAGGAGEGWRAGLLRHQQPAGREGADVPAGLHPAPQQHEAALVTAINIICL